MTSNRKYDSVKRRAFTCKTFLPNFIHIQFEMMEPVAFEEEQQEQDKQR